MTNTIQLKESQTLYVDEPCGKQSERDDLFHISPFVRITQSVSKPLRHGKIQHTKRIGCGKRQIPLPHQYQGFWKRSAESQLGQ